MKLLKSFQTMALFMAAGTMFISCKKLPEPAFSYNENALPEAGEAVMFSNDTPEASSYSWDFGDGENSSSDAPQHIYEEAGIYDVVLTATNDAGDATVSNPVTIYESTILGFHVTDSTGEVSLEGAEIWLYSDETDWDNVDEPGELAYTDENGEVYFEHMEHIVYYIYALKEAPGGTWISGGYTEELTLHETSLFSVPCQFFPEELSKSTPAMPEGMKLIRR